MPVDLRRREESGFYGLLHLKFDYLASRRTSAVTMAGLSTGIAAQIVSRLAVLPGDAAPWFKVRSMKKERFHFDTCAGRYLLLAFVGSGGSGLGQATMWTFGKRRSLFNGINAAPFVVSADPTDESEKRLPETGSVKAFWDFERKIARLYGVAGRGAGASAGGRSCVQAGAVQGTHRLLRQGRRHRFRLRDADRRQDRRGGRLRPQAAAGLLD